MQPLSVETVDTFIIFYNYNVIQIMTYVPDRDALTVNIWKLFNNYTLLQNISFQIY